MMANTPETLIRYRVTGMDCADCATEIERATSAVAGVEHVRVSIASQILSLHATNPDVARAGVEHAVRELGYQIDALGSDESLAAGTSHMTPAYRRALWIVIVLNAGYGLIEIVGGFLSDSQALKADALDFMGDGIITLLGVVAISWGLLWRARSALVQGLFLAGLGLSVLVSTVLRVQGGYEPEAGLMGGFAFIALMVNIAAALVLIPHRTGDANVRAVWLFSRNDAIGNLAVLIAAGLVAWSGTAWPDLAVALVISGLFLHSAWSIIGDARRDLHDARVRT
jgi:Co/Zn/Cd efflux system component